MRQSIIFAALAGHIAAVKWEEKIQGELNAALAQDPLLPDFDPAEVVDWWEEVYTPLLYWHAQDVANTAWQNLANEEGRAPLTEVCEEGQQCRNKVDEWMKEEIMNTWKIVLQSLKTEITSTSQKTETQVEAAWKKKVQCEVNFPCCEYDENHMKNLKMSIKDKKSAYWDFYQEWIQLEEHRKILLDECPDASWPACDEHNSNGDWCWDLNERADDDKCTCASPWVEPKCGYTICPEDFTWHEDSCKCEAPPEEEKTVFSCPPCEEGWTQVGTPPFDCKCEHVMTVCDACWDGSVPDVPNCICPERQVEFSLQPEEEHLQRVVNEKEITFETVDWPAQISINNAVNKVCWGDLWCEANFYTQDGDRYSYLAPEDQHDTSVSVCQEIPTSGLTSIVSHYSENYMPDDARWPELRWRLNGLKIYSGDEIVYQSQCQSEDNMPDDETNITREAVLPEGGVWVGVYGELQAGRIAHATQFRFAAMEQPPQE